MKNRNHMEDVANMLGLKLGEKFEIEEGDGSSYYFTEKGIVNKHGKVVAFLESLVRGEHKIIKKPWIPTDGEPFCYIHTGSKGDYFIAHSYWRNDTHDKGLYALGNFFKTEEEALDNLKAYKEFVESLTPNMSWRNG